MPVVKRDCTIGLLVTALLEDRYNKTGHMRDETARVARELVAKAVDASFGLIMVNSGMAGLPELASSLIRAGCCAPRRWRPGQATRRSAASAREVSDDRFAGDVRGDETPRHRRASDVLSVEGRQG